MLAIFGPGLASTTLASPTTLAIADAVKGASNVPVAMRFDVTRGDDTGYDAVLGYRSLDGTAFANIDYLPVSGTSLISGSFGTSVPVMLAPHPGTGVNLFFQMQLAQAFGIGPAPSFVAQTFATGAGTANIITPDLNGDGVPDVVVGNVGASHISVRLDTSAPASATPTFSDVQTFATGSSPWSIVAVDINADGRLDLVVANAAEGTVGVLINNTAIGATSADFIAQQSFATGSLPFAVAAADLNGDGRADLLVANAQDASVSVLLNATAPGSTIATFVTQQAFSVGTDPRSVAAADLDGDGRADVIVGNRGSDNVSVLINTTAPGAAIASLAAQQTFATGAAPLSVKAVDLNGDGKADLVTADHDDDSVTVLINATTPGSALPAFAAKQTFAVGATPFAVTAADVNGDGKPELIVANLQGASVSVLRNRTTPGASTASFVAAATQATGAAPIDVGVADLNRDGVPDLVSANQNDGTITILLNTTSFGTTVADFSANLEFPAIGALFDTVSADFNGDGKVDVAAAGRFGSNIVVLRNTSAPGAAIPTFAEAQSFAAGGTRGLAAADFNGDGRIDLVTASGNIAVNVLLNTTAPGADTFNFGTANPFNTGCIVFDAAAADINGDGRTDLAFACGGGNSVGIFLNTTVPGSATPNFSGPFLFNAGSLVENIATADFNGDGRPDLIVGDAGQAQIPILINTTAPGAAAPAFAGAQNFATGANPRYGVAVDINGDGKADLITANIFDASISVLLNTTATGATTASFATHQDVPLSTGVANVNAADVDGDGKPDVFVALVDNTVTFLRNLTVAGDNSPTFAAPQSLPVGGGDSTLLTTDVNGDGRLDLVVGNSDANSISVLLNTQYRCTIATPSAIGTIVHDYIFADGVD